MSQPFITIKSATLIAIVVEGVLYGFSVLMFIITFWALLYKRTARQLNRIMLTVTLTLFVLSTLHIFANAIRVYRGFIVFNGSDEYFANAEENTFKNSVYELETLVADAVLIYRCWKVWNNLSITIIPSLLWIGTAITGSHTVWSIARPAADGDRIFFLQTGRWVLSFYSIAFATNVIATGLLAYKIWTVNRAVNRMRVSSARDFPESHLDSTLRQLLFVIMECGILYSVSLITMISTYASKSNGAYIVIDMIGQIIPITFYVIIIRATVARVTEKQKRSMILNSRFSATVTGHSTQGMNVKVQIDKLGEIELGSMASNSKPLTVTEDSEGGSSKLREHGPEYSAY